MKNPVPYLRQRSDNYWEIVYEDPRTGRTRRKSTSSKDEAVAQKKLDAFSPPAADAADPDAPYVRSRTDGYWETVYKDDKRKTRRHSHGTKDEQAASAAYDVFVKELARPEIPVRPSLLGSKITKQSVYKSRGTSIVAN